MIRWLWRLLWGFDPPQQKPTSKRLTYCEDALEALQARVDKRYDELVQLRGVVSRMKRELLQEEHAEDAPGRTNGDPTESAPGPRPVTPSAELSRRFRSF